MFKVLELSGMDSYFALQAYGKMLLGLKMLPAYMHLGYSEFYHDIEKMEPKDQEKMIREGVFMVNLDAEEIMAFIQFCVDKNGVPYKRENVKKLPPEQIFEMAVAVCIELAKIKVKLTTEDEKKK